MAGSAFLRGNVPVGALTGAAAGVSLTLLALGEPPGDLFRTLPSRELAGLVLVHSLGVAIVVGSLLGALLGALLSGLVRALQRILRLPGPSLLVGLGVGGVVALERTATHQLETLAGLGLDHPARWTTAGSDALVALVVAIALALLLRRWSPGPRWGRAAGGLGVAGLLLTLAPLPWLSPRDPTEARTPERLFVVGLDGLTFRVLSPAIRSGATPEFARLVDEGAAATLVTWGAASSPRVWTSLATGKTTREHGIEDFLKARSGEMHSLAVDSRDRRVPAFWEILDHLGHRVLVLDWLLASPPDPLEHGLMVGRIHERGIAARTHPPELGSRVAQWSKRWPRVRSEAESAIRRTDRVFGLTGQLLEPDRRGPTLEVERAADPAFRVVALYDSTVDGAQHRFWRTHEPGPFDAERWGPAPPDLATRDRVLEVYRNLDDRLGELVATLDPERDLLLVVSDHGQQAANAPAVHLRLDPLLAALGWCVLDANGRADADLSRAYSLDHTVWSTSAQVRLNLRGREPRGVVAPGGAARDLERLRGALEEVRFADGSRVFSVVEEGHPDGQLGGSRTAGPTADLLIQPAPDTLDPASRGRRVLAGDRELLWDDFVRRDDSVTGAHDRQATLLAWGAGVRPGWHGPRLVSTSVQRILRHLADKFGPVEPWIRTLGRWGAIDPGTTLDLTPTILWAVDAPIGRDMAGRPWTWLLELPHPPREVDSWDSLRPPPGEAAAVADEELLQQLRALGYVG